MTASETPPDLLQLRANVAVQLGQAMRAGTLRGAEFHMIADTAPGLPAALAAGLKVSPDELARMADQGRLTVAALTASPRTIPAVLAALALPAPAAELSPDAE